MAKLIRTGAVSAPLSTRQSAVQRAPHFLVALRGPDARVLDALRLVKRTRDIKRQTVLVNVDAAELRIHARARGFV